MSNESDLPFSNADNVLPGEHDHPFPEGGYGEGSSPSSATLESYEERLQQVQTRLGRIANDVKGCSDEQPQENTAYKLLLRAMNDVEDAKKMLERYS